MAFGKSQRWPIADALHREGAVSLPDAALSKDVVTEHFEPDASELHQLWVSRKKPRPANGVSDVVSDDVGS